MLESLAAATTLPNGEVEILCSWNGSSKSEQKIINRSGYEFLIAQRHPYHFAGNMNQLAKHANGDVLAFLNDDLILDNGSLDSGLSCLLNDVSTLCVGALLRMPNGTLQHGGMAFDIHHTPYHIAEGLPGITDAISELLPYEVSCVTGAMMLVRKSTFSQQPFEEGYKRCGEDVQLNLDLRENLQGKVMICPGMSGVHTQNSTRAENNEEGNISEDLVKMRTRRRLFLEKASPEQLRSEVMMAAREHTFTQDAITMNEGMSVVQELEHLRREAQTMQLEILRLKDLTERQQEGSR